MPSPTSAAAVTRRSAILAGIRRILPFTVIAGPFGLIYGVTAAENDIDTFAAIIAAFAIMGGAAQIALVELIGDGSSWFVAVSTAIVINLRFALYSATLAGSFADFPRRWRFFLPWAMTDQAAMVGIQEFEHEADPFYRLWFFVGSAMFFATPWWIGSTLGVLIGGEIGPGWQLPFAVPVTFIALLVPSLTTRPKLIAGVVGAGVAVSLYGIPSGLNIILGAFAGIAAGTWASERAERTAEATS